MTKAFFDQYTGDDYDTYQPIRVEHYDFYHDLAFDFIPYEKIDAFRLLDLGCGTGHFLTRVLAAYPNASALALDYAQPMLSEAARKNAARTERIAFQQHDLNEGLPDAIGSFDLIAAFSSIHHLTATNKQRLYQQIFTCLEPGGWLFLIDAMTVRFDDAVYRLGKQRNKNRRRERLEHSGVDQAHYTHLAGLKAQVSEESPDRDRLSRLDVQWAWLREAGFRTVDYIWHYWMEHFIIARK